jgi:hypothetical protein
MANIADKVQSFINRRKVYRKLLLGDGNYLSEIARPVIEDLQEFCYATKTTALMKDGKIDAFAMGVAEGRRQVYLRFLTYLKMSDSDVYAYLSKEKNHE